MCSKSTHQMISNNFNVRSDMYSYSCRKITRDSTSFFFFLFPASEVANVDIWTGVAGPVSDARAWQKAPPDWLSGAC